MHRFAAIVAAAVVLAFPSLGAHAKDIDYGPVHVTTSDDPKRIDWDVVVPASLDAVWDAFTTRPGLVTWLAPDAAVQLRNGGDWLAMFPGAAPGGGSIVLYQPKTLLALTAMAPEQFPTVRKERTLAVFSFAARGAGQTEVHLAQTGWKQGSEWDKAYEYLTQGNAYLLQALYARFAKGPLDWSKMKR
jgi:uncharacterized protein YndB with AHSA1/START domain